MGDSVVTPIDRALARVRKLREAEKRMTEGPWNIETPMGDEIPWVVQDASKPTYEWECLAMFSGDGPITAKQGTDNAQGIAALRNAAPSMLALLEALLITAYAPYGEGALNLLDRDRIKLARRKKADAALAALLEAKDDT